MAGIISKAIRYVKPSGSATYHIYSLHFSASLCTCWLAEPVHTPVSRLPRSSQHGCRNQPI